MNIRGTKRKLNQSNKPPTKRRKISSSSLFSGKSFVFIGQFKNNGYKTKRCLKKLVLTHGGKNVTSISGKTDYVIFPNVITNSERNNKQTKRIPKIYSPIISFISCKWLLDCIEKDKILPVTDYKIEEFYKKLPSFSEYFNINMTRKSFCNDKISSDCKIWKEHQDPNDNIYYYNTLTDRSSTIPCEDFKKRLIGVCSITETDYTTESTGIQIINDLRHNIEHIEKCKNILKTFQNKSLF